MKSAAHRRRKIDGELEAAAEFTKFSQAIRAQQPAIATFTNQALMLIYLALGEKCLRRQQRIHLTKQAA